MVIAFNTEKKHLHTDWTVVEADAWSYEPADVFDKIVVDIWYGQEIHSNVTKLCDRYRPYLAAGGTIDYLSTVVMS